MDHGSARRCGPVRSNSGWEAPPFFDYDTFAPQFLLWDRDHMALLSLCEGALTDPPLTKCVNV